MREERETPSAMTCVCHGLLPCDRALGRYYTPAQMQDAVVTRMKKQIEQHIVKLLDAPLTHAKRERVLALLEQLSFRK